MSKDPYQGMQYNKKNTPSVKNINYSTSNHEETSYFNLGNASQNISHLEAMTSGIINDNDNNLITS